MEKIFAKSLFLLLSGTILTAALFSAGCKKHKSAADVIEQNNLHIRLFDAMQKDRSAEAAGCAAKIAAVNKKSDFTQVLLDNQMANAAIQQSQKEIDSGNMRQALQILAAARLKHSFVPSLEREWRRTSSFDRLCQDVEAYSNIMKNAKNRNSASNLQRRGLLLADMGKAARECGGMSPGFEKQYKKTVELYRSDLKAAQEAAEKAAEKTNTAKQP